MKKVLLMCCFLVGISAVSHAQGRGRQTPEQQLAFIKTSIAPATLTDDQSAKLTAVFTASAKSMDSLRTASNGDRDAMMEKMRPMRAATTAQVNAILTPDQAAAYKKAMDARRAQMQGGGGGN